MDLLCCCCRRDLAEEALGCCFMMFLVLVWMCVPISLLVTGEVVWSQCGAGLLTSPQWDFCPFLLQELCAGYRGGDSSDVQAH